MGRPVNKRYFGDYDTGTQLRVAANTGNGAVDTSTGSVLLGERVIFGTAAGVNDRLPIKKLFNRTATDFDGNRYSWEIQNDSTQTLLVLTSF
jgi:hypothetical protein